MGALCILPSQWISFLIIEEEPKLSHKLIKLGSTLGQDAE